MATFRLTNKAKADLKSIAAYTQRQWGTKQRKINIQQFDDAFHLLSDSPEIGTACEYIREDYFKFPVTSHLVFYKNISSSEIEIVRILH